MFKPVTSRVSFPQMETEIIRFWKEKDIFHKTERDDGRPLFVLYEGPPTANGNPGLHHVLARVFKDVIPRYKTMKGYRPLRQGGWDTHGLPVELEVEKELGISTKGDIEAYGVERFNQRCRDSVFRYVKEWEELTDRIAFWVDMEHAYVTFKNDYIESCWWIIKQLWDRGLIYQGYKVTPHCPRCVTSLSSHEVALGYQENTPDPSVYVRFRLTGYDATVRRRDAFGGVFPRLQSHGQPVYFLAWTTTPWTLTANVALAVNPNEEYVLVEAPEGQSEERLIIARARKNAVLGPEGREVATVTGSDLVGLYYEPLYKAGDPQTDGHPYQHHVEAADFVSMEDGTGIVHIAPAYGAEDQELGRDSGLPTIHTVDLQGHLSPEWDFPGGGKFVKDADEDIMRDLQGRDLLYKREVIHHTYPFCWRCASPLLYYAKSSWYIRTTAVKERLLSGNQEINWFPDYIKDGRFGEWLRNNVDWAISRERYWGTPIPLWQCQGCGKYDCIGTIQEMRSRLKEGEVPSDLHRPYVDGVVLRCDRCGGDMRRIPEVMDVWFDSGAMPFAQAHVTSKDDLEALEREGRFPADYICEAVDQTRGWFYSLHAISTLLLDTPSYRNVICLGLIQDEKGEKMSKSRGNAVQPWEVINSHGADALRWYLLTAAPPGNNRRFSASLVGEGLRRFLLTLWNTYSFFVTYANIDRFDPRQAEGVAASSEMDRWVLSELHSLVDEVTRLLEEYNPTDAGRRIEEFVDLLSNWYVRRSRRRFWKSENDQDKLSAHHTLYTCLVTLTKLIAPLTPFVAEEMYQNLVRSVYPEAPESVHLAPYPVADLSQVDPPLSQAIRLAMKVSSLGRSARSKAGIKVRQPLSKLLVKLRSSEEEAVLQKVSSQIVDELNVKEVAPLDREEEVLAFQVRLNPATAGAKYGAQVPRVRAALSQADPTAIAIRVRGGSTVEVGGFTLQPEEVAVTVTDRPGHASATEGGYTVTVSTELTPELVEEGLARELVHRLQGMRRSAGFDIADHIVTYYSCGGGLAGVIGRFADYIRQETLSQELVEGESPDGAYSEGQRIEEWEVVLGVVRRA
ncbi:MAG: ileS [Dehalococcoidia bacterium]|nr:ileS [Dehalococcoidia bacterium]